MNNNWLKNTWPHLAAIAIFLVVSVLYCSPAIKGDVVNQQDHLQWRAMAQKSFEFKEKYGHFPLWTNSMFSGMPAYQIALEADHPVSIGYVYYILTLGLPKPANFFFLACVLFYVLMLVMRINPWIGVMASIAYAFSTYDPVIVVTGHDTKMQAIAYAPAVIASFLLLFRKNYLGGAVMLAFSLGMQLSTAHLQMVYYTLLTAGIMALVYLWHSVKNKEVLSAVKAYIVAALVTVLSIGTTAVSTLTTYDYAKYSMRGGESEIAMDTSKTATKGGLDKTYAFNWSYGIPETFTIFHPSFYGGGNGGHQLGASSKMVGKLSEVGYPEENAVALANNFSYWGSQPGTSGPVYFGIIIGLLFVLGIVLIQSWHKWWILAATLFTIILAWGKNFEAVNYFLFDYLPFYKKFRAPTQSLVVPQLAFPLLGAMVLQQILFGDLDRERLLKKLKLGGMIMGGIFALCFLFYFMSDFMSPGDSRLRDNFSGSYMQQMSQGNPATAELQMQAQEFGKSFVTAIQEDRKSLFMTDLIRNLVLAGMAFGALFFFARGKMGRSVVLGAILVLSSFDLLNIATRYLNSSDYTESDLYQRAYTPSAADMQIKQDTGYFRVFNQATGSPFDDAFTSYHHNSVGGYHPAKLRIYQDLLEGQFSSGNKNVLDMLNTRYFIFQNPQNGQPVAQFNPDAFGPAWLARELKFVKDGKEEMKAMDSTDLRTTALVQDRFKEKVGSLPVWDSTASLRLLENKNDVITYAFNASSPQYGVFSEIYYEGGWKAFGKNNQELPIIKTNYALRGLALPAGNYTITFRFEPESYKMGNTISMIASILVYLLLIAFLVLEFRKSKKGIQTEKS